MTAMFNEITGALPQDPRLAKSLRDFGARLLDKALSNEQAALIRVTSMESDKFRH